MEGDACRDLFGSDHNATKAILREQKAIIEEEDKNKYNFDFRKGEPLANDPDQRYNWERITPPVSPDKHGNDANNITGRLQKMFFTSELI